MVVTESKQKNVLEISCGDALATIRCAMERGCGGAAASFCETAKDAPRDERGAFLRHTESSEWDVFRRRSRFRLLIIDRLCQYDQFSFLSDGQRFTKLRFAI